jgi:hypothetical protein
LQYYSTQIQVVAEYILKNLPEYEKIAQEEAHHSN